MGEISHFFVASSWNFVSGCIKNVDTHPESFSSKKQVIKKLSQKSLWQTYMKWTVERLLDSHDTFVAFQEIVNLILNIFASSITLLFEE